MDEVGLFNVALTEDDIKRIMTEGLKGFADVTIAGKLATVWGSVKAD